MTEYPELSARLTVLAQPLVDAGWREKDRLDDWDYEAGSSVTLTLERGRDILDVELFDANWVQLYVYDVGYEPDDDNPSEPDFSVDDPADLEAECRTRGLLG